jgi:hypothetical protein
MEKSASASVAGDTPEAVAISYGLKAQRPAAGDTEGALKKIGGLRTPSLLPLDKINRRSPRLLVTPLRSAPQF